MPNAVFQGKVALVTGAASGIGLATARAFAAAGASVVLADVQERPLKEAVREVAWSGGRVVAIGCDVTDDAEVASMFERIDSELGRLDAAFNNAGVIGRPTDFAELSGAEWDRIMAVNVRGVWSCMRHELPQMLRNGGGAIVNCSSIGGLKGVPGLAAYGASKHAVIGLTKSAALEYVSRGIRVNAVCPGMIETPMADVLTGGDAELRARMSNEAPMGRVGRPEEIAAAVLWLCSPEASYVVGDCLTVDAGLAAR